MSLSPSVFLRNEPKSDEGRAGDLRFSALGFSRSAQLRPDGVVAGVRIVPTHSGGTTAVSRLRFVRDGQGVNLTAMSDAEFAKARDKLFRYFAGPCVRGQLLRDTTAEDKEERRALRRALRRFMVRHPIRYARLPR